MKQIYSSFWMLLLIQTTLLSQKIHHLGIGGIQTAIRSDTMEFNNTLRGVTLFGEQHLWKHNYGNLYGRISIDYSIRDNSSPSSFRNTNYLLSVQAGIGYVWGMGKRIQMPFYANLTYLQMSEEVDLYDFNSIGGWGGQIGLRLFLTNRLGVYGNLGFVATLPVDLTFTNSLGQQVIAEELIVLTPSLRIGINYSIRFKKEK